MNSRIAKYQIGDLARLSGVSVRMLRHYDQIGLLPAVIGENGYRYYDEAGLKRLQEILFYRAFELGLEEIRLILASDDRLERLRLHRDRLRLKHQEMAQLLAALDTTITREARGQHMSAEELYAPFSPEKQAEYEDWLTKTYGPEMAEAIAVSKAHLAQVPEGMEGRMRHLQSIEEELVTAFTAGETDVDALLERHRAWVASMWGKDCPKVAYAGLADMYLAHPDFVARYEALAPKFSQWLPAQMKDYATRGQG